MHLSLCCLVIQQASFCRPLPDFYLPARTNVFASKDRQQQPHEPAAYVLSLCLCFLHSSFFLYPSSSLFFSICLCWQTSLDVIHQEDLSRDEEGQTWVPPSFPLHYTSTVLAYFCLIQTLVCVLMHTVKMCHNQLSQRLPRWAFPSQHVIPLAGYSFRGGSQ